MVDSRGTLLWLIFAGFGVMAGCEECEPGHVEVCDCGHGLDGRSVCVEDGSAWGECECDPCAQFVATMCACDGVEEFYEALDTTCAETYQPIVDEGDPDVCEQAMAAFEADGGCDMFDVDGDDDDTIGDDDIGGDDDDATPAYMGDIDMDASLMYGECTIGVPNNPNRPWKTARGWYDFEIELVGWALDCWINLRDTESDYCEAYDPVTGDPCESEGHTRGGWSMTNASYGWDPVYGFWDYWTAYVEYIMDLDAAVADYSSTFICEDAGTGFSTEFCCQDYHTEVLYCAEYEW